MLLRLVGAVNSPGVLRLNEGQHSKHKAYLVILRQHTHESITHTMLYSSQGCILNGPSLHPHSSRIMCLIWLTKLVPANVSEYSSTRLMAAHYYVSFSAIQPAMLCTAGVLTQSVERVQLVFHTAAPVGQGFALTTVSAVRCLNVYLERLGLLSQSVPGAEVSSLQKTIVRAFESARFISVQPSLLAAVVYQACKESQGSLPAWPSALADLTGWKGDCPHDSQFYRVLVAMRAFVSGV